MSESTPAVMVVVWIAVLRLSAKPWTGAIMDARKRTTDDAPYLISHVALDAVIHSFYEYNASLLTSLAVHRDPVKSDGALQKL